MEAFLNAIKAHAAALDQTLGQPRLATISSVDTAMATARALLQPEGVLTGWLPVLSPWTGAGWGLVCPPSPGDQVLVLGQEGIADHGLIVGSAYSATNKPPQAAPGEFCVVHSSGNSLRFGNDGTVYLNGPVVLDGSLHVTGSITSEADVSDSSGSLSRLRKHYDAHYHMSGSNKATPQD